MISFKDVTKKYSKEVALEDISFDIAEGEFVFLTGVSGSGKTTIIKLLYKEFLPSKGKIEMFGKDITKISEKKLRRKMGIVFQNYELLKNKTVLENVGYPLDCMGVFPSKVRKEALMALDKLNMSEYAKKLPNELSGGQQQRVAIARAMVNKPKLLICDEPTGNLDGDNTKIIMDYLNELNSQGTTIIMSTHSEDILKEMDKRVIHIENGKMLDDGRSFLCLDSFENEEPLVGSSIVLVNSEQGQRKVEILNELGWNSEKKELKLEGGK